MVLAQFQIYTLSNMDGWIRKGDGKGNYLPDGERKRYDSNSFNFKEWIKLSQQDFEGASRWLNENASALQMEGDHVFSLMTSQKPGMMFKYGSNGDFLYMKDGVLVAIRPRRDQYVTAPSSPHFQDGDLAEHINLALFGESKQSLEAVAKKLQLPERQPVTA